ncbi:MAG: HAMP domain-containing protein [Nitrospirae bacterium]|nr:HAMP domain-containing protein [Nitrospirota bacterium]
MELNVSKKIIYSELVIIAVIFSTLIPYILVSMQFSTTHLFHYLFITIVILAPIGIFSAYYFMERWECRPIEMLSFYLKRGLNPPDDVMSEARTRALNLPIVHAATVLIRYELVTLLDCLYMGTIGGLPLKENIKLGLYAGIGLAFFPIFSFFLTERLLYPVRQFLAEKTRNIVIDESKVIHINTRTRLVSILLATVAAPLVALGVLMYQRVGMELGSMLSGFSPNHPVMDQLFNLIFLVTVTTLILTSGIGVLLATSISNPLGHMMSVIRRLEKGDLNARSNLISNDEIGVLSQSFDKMAQEIEKNRVELEDLNRNLEFRVAEKTEHLTKAYERLQLSNQNLAVANRELELANKKLKELDQLKSDFISVVSHELRTPLTSIKAFTELILIKNRMTTEKRSRFLSIINNETDRLARLINDILDLTKIEAGKLSWHVTQVSLPEVIRTSVANIQSLADNKSLVMQLNMPAPLPRLFGDRDRLVQVITNILSNAIKFTPDGGSISIETSYEEQPRKQLMVHITDTGVGIPHKHLDTIFEKFRRSGDALTNGNEGTGLGLAITKQIVEYHGGRIWAESTPGSGSTFSFTLPLDKVWKIEGDNLMSAMDL